MVLYENINTLPEEYIKSKINDFLSEDIPTEDWTTIGTIPEGKTVIARLTAQQDLIFAGEKVVNYVFSENVRVELKKKDGEFTNDGETILSLEGDAREILTKERLLLNILQHLCGIATTTAEYVKIAKPYGVHVLDTRKTTPGLRLFEKYAVSCGGGTNHRLNLSSGILIKDNHISAAGGVFNAVSNIKKLDANLPIELEVDTKEQLMEGLEVGVDGFLLDNMSPDLCKECVEIVRAKQSDKPIFIEASGGIKLNNLESYMQTGIDAISTGAVTNSFKAADMHLEFE